MSSIDWDAIMHNPKHPDWERIKKLYNELEREDAQKEMTVEKCITILRKMLDAESDNEDSLRYGHGSALKFAIEFLTCDCGAARDGKWGGVHARDCSFDAQ